MMTFGDLYQKKIKKTIEVVAWKPKAKVPLQQNVKPTPAIMTKVTTTPMITASSDIVRTMKA